MTDEQERMNKCTDNLDCVGSILWEKCELLKGILGDRTKKVDWSSVLKGLEYIRPEYLNIRFHFSHNMERHLLFTLIKTTARDAVLLLLNLENGNEDTLTHLPVENISQ